MGRKNESIDHHSGIQRTRQYRTCGEAIYRQNLRCDRLCIKYPAKCESDVLFSVYDRHRAAGHLSAHPYIYQILDIGGKKLPVAAGCELMDRTEKEFGLKIRLYYLEEVANKVIDLQFEGDKVKIRAVGTPNLVKFMEKLFGEAMMQRTKKLGRWKDSTFLKEKMKKVLFPESEGIAR